MPKQKKTKLQGEMADGSFDISDVPESPEDLEGALADAFGEEGAPDEGPDLPTGDAEPPGHGAEPHDDEPQGDASDDAPRRPSEALVDADEEVARLLHERDEAIEARKRAMADFVNYRRRADENEIRARQAGVADVVRSLLPMLDHLDLALGQEEAEMTTEQLLEGVRMVSDEVAKALEQHQVRLVDPEIGTEFDPNEHQAVMRARTDDHPPNSIAAVFQVGYAVNDMILRPASVSVTAPMESAGD